MFLVNKHDACCDDDSVFLFPSLAEAEKHFSVDFREAVDDSDWDYVSELPRCDYEGDDAAGSEPLYLGGIEIEFGEEIELP